MLALEDEQMAYENPGLLWKLFFKNYCKLISIHFNTFSFILSPLLKS